ncbi:hypothetical protein F5Y12DRAFT_748217 [Xylaria sp. FL1777]|nr:hypothetical protein F5Y12DRAFT_748217 [Xylaria sp. FL1777]
MSTQTSTQTHPNEQIVNIFDEMPHRYMFVPGTGALATRCKERTHAIGRAVYIVHDSAGRVEGVRVPHYIVESTMFEETEGESHDDTEDEVSVSSDSDWEWEEALRLSGLDTETSRGESEWVDSDGYLNDADDEYDLSGDSESVDSDSTMCDEGYGVSEDETVDPDSTLKQSDNEDEKECFDDTWFVKV